MKLSQILPIIIATACFAFTGCNKAVDEKTAIANFKTEVEIFAKWAEEKGKAAQTDPSAGMAMMGELAGKMKGIKTDGVPADLKAAWGDMAAVMGEMADIFKGVPTTKPEKPEDAMKMLAEIGPKMQNIQAKVTPIIQKLQEVGTKYGLDMSKVGPK